MNIAGDPRIFPGPPDAELPAIDGPPTRTGVRGAISPRLADTETAIGDRLPTDKRETFGRYLYAVLVGDTVWQRMLETAVAAGVRLIELSICSTGADPRFQELNWEMLHGPHRFLAAGAQCDGTSHRFSVAITRRVASAAEMPVPMKFPPRLLFVVGASLTDKDIKPGAEVLGLLEQFERDGTRVQSRVLQRQQAPQRSNRPSRASVPTSSISYATAISTRGPADTCALSKIRPAPITGTSRPISSRCCGRRQAVTNPHGARRSSCLVPVLRRVALRPSWERRR